MIVIFAKRLLATMTIGVLLTSCGGSGPVSFEVQSLTGQWSAACFPDSSNTVYHYTDTVRFSPTPGGASFSGTLTVYDSAQCAGPAMESADYEGELRTGKAAVVGGEAGVKGVVTDAEQNSVKTTLVVRGTRLTIGDPDAALDIDGYPATLRSQVYARTN